MPKRLPSHLSGAAGEHYVVAELSRRGVVASITPRNTQSIDILASNADGSRQVGIQVKTTQGSENAWLLDKKAERLHSPTMYYVFVRLNGSEGKPTYHVVESKVIADHVRRGHIEWLRPKKRGGGLKKDTSMRMFRDIQ